VPGRWFNEVVDPLEVMGAYAAAWERGDPEAAWAFYAPDVVMRLPGRGTLAGEHVGREAVIGAIKALLDRTSDTSAQVEVLDRLVSADRVGMLLREVVVRGEQRLELRRVNLYRVADGLITDIDIFEADQYDVDAFFG
jgi:ketosteroid isomerase-like protein